MNPNYDEVRSAFIRDEIEGTAWQDRQRIDDLIRLDGLIDAPHRGFAGSIEFHHLRRAYPRQYLRLVRERGTERLQAALSEIRLERAERRRLEQDRREREAAAREAWLRAGGRP